MLKEPTNVVDETTNTNKLPTFGNSANLDSAIIANTSSLAETGFQPNTLIESAQVNTYIKMLTNALYGLIEVIRSNDTDQSDLFADSAISNWQNYIYKGLAYLIKNTKVDVATSSDKAFILSTSRKISLSGDIVGNASFDGSKDISIEASVNSAEALKSKNIGDATHPVYFDANGKPVEITSVERANSIGSNQVGSKTRPVYINSSGKPSSVSLFSTYQILTGTKTVDGLYKFATLSKLSTFWAQVEVIANDTKVLLTGLVKFKDGYASTEANGSNIANNNTSVSTVVTHIISNLFGNSVDNTTVVSLESIYGDGHSVPFNPNKVVMRIDIVYEE